MTIEELYKWAIQNGVRYYNIEIQYRDDGGNYPGTETLDKTDIVIDDSRHEVVL